MSEQPVVAPVDLSPLDPFQDAARMEQIVGSVMARAAAELEHRRENADVLVFVTRWTRPVLVAAALLLAVSVVALQRLSFPAGLDTTSPSLVAVADYAEAVGMPESLASWVQGAPMPGPGQLLYGIEDTR